MVQDKQDIIGNILPLLEQANAYVLRNIQAGVGVGPLTFGQEFTATHGNAVTTPEGGDFLGSNGGSALEPASTAGARFGFSSGVEFGSYTNWKSRPSKPY